MIGASLALILAVAGAGPVPEAKAEWKAGNPRRAAELYADALPGNPGVRHALKKSSTAAIRRELERGRALEEEHAWVEAIRIYVDAVPVARRARDLGVPLAIEDELTEQLAFARASGRRERMRAAESARASGQFPAALTHLELAAEFGQSLDVDRRVEDTWRSWALNELFRDRIRSAADKLAQPTNSSETHAEAAALYGVLGRWHLDRRSCRQATADLRMARQLDPEGGFDPAEAQACATASLVVSVAGAKQVPQARQARIRQALAESIARESTAFLDPLAAEPRARGIPGGGEEGPFAVVLEIRTLSTTSQALGSTPRWTAALQQVPCGRRDTLPPPPCETPVQVEVAEMLGSTTSRMVAELVIADRGPSGRELVRVPIDESMDLRHRWGGEVSKVEFRGRSVPLFDGVRYPPADPNAPLTAEESRARATELTLERLGDRVVAIATRHVLQALDRVVAVPDPTPEELVEQDRAILGEVAR